LAWRGCLFVLALCPVLAVLPVILTVYVVAGSVKAAEEAIRDAVWVHGQFYDMSGGGA